MQQCCYYVSDAILFFCFKLQKVHWASTIKFNYQTDNCLRIYLCIFFVFWLGQCMCFVVHGYLIAYLWIVGGSLVNISQKVHLPALCLQLVIRAAFHLFIILSTRYRFLLNLRKIKTLLYHLAFLFCLGLFQGIIIHQYMSHFHLT